MTHVTLVTVSRVLDSQQFVLGREGAALEQEIAALCEAPLGTVYSRLRLAREAFQRGVLRLEARDRFCAQKQRPHHEEHGGGAR